MEIGTGCSVIVPVFQEAENIPHLIKRISNVNFDHMPFEVILMDDNSHDGTVEVVEQLIRPYPWLRLIVRQCDRGLGLSIIDGMNQASYPLIIIMDADLSHPPEKIPEMMAILSNPTIDMVIGSRFTKGGSIDDQWPRSRKLTSFIAACIANSLLQKNIRDPLSGFIAIRKETYLRGPKLDGVGWKIGLELMLKCPCTVIKEIPIHFQQRQYGQSKLNLKVALNYLKQIYQLIRYKLSKSVFS